MLIRAFERYSKRNHQTVNKNNKSSEPGDTRGLKIIWTIEGSSLNRKEVIRRMEKKER